MNLAMLMYSKKNNKFGFSLLELVFAVAIFASGAISIGLLIIESTSISDLNGKKITTTLLAREGLEAVRSIRDEAGFSELVNGSYGVSLVAGSWTLVAPDTTDDIYLRTITIEDSGLNSDIKLITSSVTVSGNVRDITTTLSTYLGDWHD